NVTFSDSGALTIGPAATLTMTDDRSVTVTAGSPTLTNNGLFQKAGGTGTSTIATGITFSNAGTLAVASGTVSLQAATTNTGTLNVGPGATLRIDGSTTLNAGTAVTGTGTLSVSATGTL